MKLYKLSFLLFLVLGGCCKDEIVESKELNEFEKSLIPYNSFQELNFIDEQGNTVIANSQPKESIFDKRRAGPESCRLFEYEREINSLNFQSQNILIKIELNNESLTDFFLTVIREHALPNEKFDLACDELFSLTIQERLTNLTVNQFDFENILVFQNCSESAEIVKIIYSPTNGIEFIEFDNGTWLKLDN
ncbi:hypothetical protein [uncultured Zobellia sp.]|uniref:hypothetical protein n=1 Tax=uncultured Zobellia sp. TaxID=255433 RepID=UPI00259A4337|nr:hypothetical protein [uncultured Zobellia sp.]